MIAAFFKPGFKRQDPDYKRPHGVPPITYWASEVCKRYGLTPLGLPANLNARVRAGILSLGGGYNRNNILENLSQQGLQPLVDIRDVSVLGARNQPGSDADVENALDAQIFAAVYLFLTGMPALIDFVFAPNSDQGIAEGIATVDANGCIVGSFSWGGKESDFPPQSRATVGGKITNFVNRGGRWCAASGDNGSSDGGSGSNVDYTGSDPNTLCIGGTTLTATDETVWGTNTPGTGGGGGLSGVYGKNARQNGNSTTQRSVPDFAANADPETGWRITDSGGVSPIGGTSASTPFWAAVIAALDTARRIKGLAPIPNFADWAYANPVCFNDITVGNNGQYRAKSGFDQCTGLGTPNGPVLVSKYLATTPVDPPPVTPPPQHPIQIDFYDAQLLGIVSQRLRLHLHSPAAPTDLIGLGH